MELKNELYDIVQVEDPRTKLGEAPFSELPPLRSFRGNYGVPRKKGNQVIKGFFNTEKNTLNKLVALQDEYLTEISRYIPVIPTEIVVEGNEFYLIQPFVDGKTFEEILKGKELNKDKTEAYKKLLYQSLDFIIQSRKTVGIDAKPENWMIDEGGKWHFIDTFPPFLFEDKNYFEEIFNLRDFEKAFTSNPERSYFRNIRKVARRFWLKSEKFAALDYFGATVDVLRNFDSGAQNFFKRMVRGYK